MVEYKKKRKIQRHLKQSENFPLCNMHIVSVIVIPYSNRLMKEDIF